MKIVYLLIMLLITTIFPDVALAQQAQHDINLKGGVGNIIGFLQLVIIISVLGFAIISFFKGEVVRSIISAVVAGILIAVTNIDTLRTLGEAILGLFKG